MANLITTETMRSRTSSSTLTRSLLISNVVPLTYQVTSSGSELNAKRIVNMKIKDAEDKASKRPFSRTLRRLLEAPPENSAVSP